MEGEEREKEEKGFVVRDKRHLFKEEGKQPPEREEKAEKTEADEPGLEEARKEKAEAREQRREEPKEQKKVKEREAPLPGVTFSNFVFSLSTQALIQLGEIQDPESGKTVKNLSLAKQTIDLIGMLQEKTKGNLTKEEEALVDSALYDLRMRYVKAAG